MKRINAKKVKIYGEKIIAKMRGGLIFIGYSLLNLQFVLDPLK